MTDQTVTPLPPRPFKVKLGIVMLCHNQLPTARSAC